MRYLIATFGVAFNLLALYLFVRGLLFMKHYSLAQVSFGEVDTCCPKQIEISVLADDAAREVYNSLPRGIARFSRLSCLFPTLYDNLSHEILISIEGVEETIRYLYGDHKEHRVSALREFESRLFNMLGIEHTIKSSIINSVLHELGHRVHHAREHERWDDITDKHEEQKRLVRKYRDPYRRYCEYRNTDVERYANTFANMNIREVLRGDWSKVLQACHECSKLVEWW